MVSFELFSHSFFTGEFDSLNSLEKRVSEIFREGNIFKVGGFKEVEDSIEIEFSEVVVLGLDFFGLVRHAVGSFLSS